MWIRLRPQKIKPPRRVVYSLKGTGGRTLYVLNLFSRHDIQLGVRRCPASTAVNINLAQNNSPIRTPKQHTGQFAVVRCDEDLVLLYLGLLLKPGWSIQTTLTVETDTF